MPRYLGIPKFRRHVVDREPEIGVVVGLAWTIAGGEILEIEVAAVPGAGKITITGNLKDVMKESAETALSYARGRCRDISAKWFKDNQIHIHVPEGAIPKDGPSAGIAMATAIVSLLRGVPVRNDVAMTGEVTLRGKVLPIGGLPEKAVAAVRAGSKHLIIPRDNEKDFRELSPVIRTQADGAPGRDHGRGAAAGPVRARPQGRRGAAGRGGRPGARAQAGLRWTSATSPARRTWRDAPSRCCRSSPSSGAATAASPR